MERKAVPHRRQVTSGESNGSESLPISHKFRHWPSSPYTLGSLSAASPENAKEIISEAGSEEDRLDQPLDR